VAEKKVPIATDSAAELHELIGDDATATFESDPNFVDSNPTADASSEHVEMRDTDDMEDSDEEEDEAGLEDDDDDDVEDDDEDDDDEDEDDGDDEFEEDEDEDDPDVLRTAEPTNVHGPGKRSKTDIERELEEMEDENAGDEGIDAPQDEDQEEEKDDEEFHVERAVDEALRMRASAGAAQLH
jgi:segregation and condensation protein B